LPSAPGPISYVLHVLLCLHLPPLCLLKAQPPPLDQEMDHFGRPLLKDGEVERARELRRLDRQKRGFRIPGRLDGEQFQEVGRLGADRDTDYDKDGAVDPFARHGNPRGGDQGAKRIINNPNNQKDNLKGPLGINNFVNHNDDADDDDNDYADDYDDDIDDADDDDFEEYNDDDKFQVQPPRGGDGKAGAMGGMGPKNPQPIVGNLGMDGGDEGMKGPLGQGQMDRPDQVVIPQQGALENQVYYSHIRTLLLAHWWE